MSNHQFKLGDVVEFASLFASKVATSSYEVIRLLPSEDRNPPTASRTRPNNTSGR